MAVKKITPPRVYKTKSLGIRLTPDMLDKLNTLAKEHKVSVSRIVELAIEEYLKSLVL